jgi:hypothetical protein
MKYTPVTKRCLASYITIMNNKPLLDWDILAELGSWQDDAPAIQAPKKSARDPEIDVTETEMNAMATVLPANWGRERRDTISAALWLVFTRRPWTLLPARLGSWDAQRRRFSRWAHAGHWSRIAEAIEACPDVPDARKALYRSVADKAARQKALLPEYRRRVCGFRE